MDKMNENFPLPSIVALLIVERDGLTATFEAMLEVIKGAYDLSQEDLEYWKARCDEMLRDLTAINNMLAKYSESLKTGNASKPKQQPVEAVEQYTAETASNCYLNYLEHKCLLFFVEEISKVLSGGNNLTGAEKERWLERLELYTSVSQTSLKMVTNEMEFYEREKAINALVPFVNKAHLN
jgi:hypothetical protein